MGVYVKCDGLGEEAVMSHGQVRGTTDHSSTTNGQSTYHTLLLHARHFSDCAARSRGPSMADHFQASTTQQPPKSNPPPGHALPNTPTSAQCSLPPRTATRPSQLLGASRPLGDTDILHSLRPPAAYSCPCVLSSAPFGVLLTSLFLP